MRGLRSLVKRQYLGLLLALADHLDPTSGNLQAGALAFHAQSAAPGVRAEIARVGTGCAPAILQPGVGAGAAFVRTPCRIEAPAGNQLRFGIENPPERIEIVYASFPQIRVIVLPGMMHARAPARLGHRAEHGLAVNLVARQSRKRPGGCAKPRVLSDKNLNPPGVRLRHNLPGLRQTLRKRLLHHHMLAPFDRIHTHLCVQVWRRDDNHGIRLVRQRQVHGRLHVVKAMFVRHITRILCRLQILRFDIGKNP